VREQGHSEFADREAEERFATEHAEEHMRRREFLTKTAMLAGAAGLASALPAKTLISQAASVQTAPGLPSPSNMPIDTFVVLMQENRSFDHYFGWHPNADAKNAGLSYPDDQGLPHPTHPLAPEVAERRVLDRLLQQGRHPLQPHRRRRLHPL
jgi:phospholipase C